PPADRAGTAAHGLCGALGALSGPGDAMKNGGPRAAVFLRSWRARWALPDALRSSATHHESPITNHQLPITNYQSPITNHQSRIPNPESRIPNPESRIPSIRHLQRQRLLDLFHHDVALGLAHVRQGEQAAAQQL